MAAGEVQRECGLDVLPEEYANEALKFGLVEVPTGTLIVGSSVYLPGVTSPH
jgi:hypothetical protein